MIQLPEGLPDAVYSEIARLEIELYDARHDAYCTNALIMMAVGLLCLAIWWFGRIGTFVYTGGASILIPALIFIPLSVSYYISRDRKNRRSLDRD